jgi:hypothetical protein
MNKPCGPLTLLATSRNARWWTVGAGVVLFLVGGYAYLWRMHQFFHGVLVGETGPVSLRADWPQPLKDLLADLEGIEIDESTIQVHRLCQGFDPEFVWRMDAAPGLFELIEKRWMLTRVDDPKWYKLEGYRSGISGVPTPAWWSPRDDGQTSFYVSPQVLAAGKSDRFHVALDEKRSTIWVYYWFNF